MLDRKYFAKIKDQHAAYEKGRRDVIKLSGDALSAAKRAIFALHRDDAATADALLKESAGLIDKVWSMAKKIPGLTQEGSYRAALEEYVEASLYRAYVRDGKISQVDLQDIDYETYLGGLTDLVGELQRRQVRLATEGKTEAVKALKDEIEAIVVSLLEMDLGGYLRTKFDQAKNSLRRAEDVLYEVTIRRS
jgi:predicted translin family RNA/ssDNA-binding protein